MSERSLAVTRRTFMQGAMATASFAALTGCHHRVMDDGKLIPPPGFDPAKTPLTIDVHCHIFNGTDLQVAAFLTETGVLGEPVNDLLQTLNWTFAKTGEAELAQLQQLHAECRQGPSPGCATQTIQTASVPAALDTAMVCAKTKTFVSEQHREAQLQVGKALDAPPVEPSHLQMALHATEILEAPGEATGTPNHGPSGAAAFQPEDLTAMRAQAAAVQATATAAYQARIQNAREARQSLRGNFPSPRTSETISVSSGETEAKPQQAKSLNKNSGVVEFFIQYFCPRYVSAQDYLDTFCRKGKRNVDLMLASLVDYDWWLTGGTPALTSLQVQIDVMEQIAILSGGRVHGFAPFCPLREVAYRANKTDWKSGRVTWSSLDLVKTAVSKRGFVGVKMYPPMGFAPYGNAELDDPNAPAPTESMGCSPAAKPGRNFWNAPGYLPAWLSSDITFGDGTSERLGVRLDQVLDELYAWCASEGVPILAHTNTSNGRNENYMALAEAGYWAKALARHKDLRVNFGHMGGFDMGDHKSDVPCAAAQYLEMLGNDGAGRHYGLAFGDTAYEESMLRDPKDQGERIGTAYEKYPAMINRFLYGTDWSLLITQGKNNWYLRNFIQQMEHLDKSHPISGPSLSERFFGWNAVEYVGLEKDGQARKRLEAFYDCHGVPRPGWMQKVDTKMT
jgi:predicted TIM-barrel fold metal-dependent hydrolase